MPKEAQCTVLSQLRHPRLPIGSDRSISLSNGQANLIDLRLACDFRMRATSPSRAIQAQYGTGKSCVAFSI